MANDLVNVDFDSCREAMTILAGNQQEDLNEADTRHQVIDVLIHQCLGWERRYVRVEEKAANGFADYVFSVIRPCLVIEAKRTSDYFNLPIGVGKRKYILRNLCKGNNNLKNAIEQATAYCNSKGIVYGAVFNGSQLVVFVATRTDGCEVMGGNAIVFRSLSDMENNFIEVWNLLSFEAINTKKIDEQLFKKEEKDLPKKISSQYIDYPGMMPRNPEQTELKVIADYVLEDILKKSENQKTFLELCYSKSGAIPQNNKLNKNIYLNRYGNLCGANESQLETTPVSDKKGLSSSLMEIISNGAVINSRPILIIGDVGVGKTTFIENLVQVEAADVLVHTVVLRIDLGIRANMTLAIKKAIFQEISTQLLSNYGYNIEELEFVRNVYRKELARYKSGILKGIFELGGEKAIEAEAKFLQEKTGDIGDHVRNSLEYIAGLKKKQVILFIDNCDQRSDTDQQAAFLIASEIANRIEIPVFVTIRPETYHRSMKYGALSGYHPRAFTVSPPRIDDVIKKRLLYSLKIANGDVQVGLDTSRMKLEKIKTLIEVMLHSFEQNQELMNMVENLSGGNVRQAINLINNFFGSPHVDTEKILRHHNNPTPYSIPFHEFFKSIIYGDHIYYFPKDSVIVNLLSVASRDEKEHFLMPLFLTILKDRHQSTPEGYIEFSELFTGLESLGFTSEQIEQTAKNAYSKNLIEITPKGDEIGNDLTPTSARITTIGNFHIEVILRRFAYMDAIIPDTTILDQGVQKTIEEERADIAGRIEKARVFLSYLRSKWQAKSSILEQSSFSFSIFDKNLTDDILKTEKSSQRYISRNN
jgi:GTPase SAR1 family protein